ncbi:MAG: CoA-binding protein [Acidobacteriota bacterium]|nr:CoA-binding protein [Acidobacteriota bacterium]
MLPSNAKRLRTIAVVGASTDRRKYGNKCVRAYARAGWKVFPVNPRAGKIEGLQSFAKLAKVPVELDRVSVYLPPAVTLEVLAEIAASGAALTFFNPGAANETVVAEARALGFDFSLDCSIVDIGLNPSQFP